MRLLGVNRSGAEYECVEEGKIFDGPTDRASIEAMESWQINAVRVPLNESCWLGINGVDPSLGGATYRAAIREYVTALERAGLYVILDLHWTAPRHGLATGLLPLPDAEHAPDFWRSVATEYRDDRGVIFDLYNEPHDVTWECWSAACTTYDPYFGAYPSVGLPELLAVVRATGAKQPVMLGGLDWSRDMRGWLAHRRHGPGSRPDRRQPHLRLLGLRSALSPGAGQHRPLRPGRHRRARRDRLQPPLHRPLHELGRPPRHLLPGLDLGHRQRLDL